MGMVVVGIWTGREARALRLGLRMTVERFAEPLGVAARTVAKWEAQGSGIAPMPAIQEVLDTALERTTPAQEARFELLLGGAPGRRPGDNEDMNRRDLLVNFAVLGLAASLAGVEAVRQGLTAAVAGDRHAADADEWDRIVHEYARSFYTTPTDRLLRDLTADLSVLQVRLGETDGAVQRGLARAGGQLAAISAVAWADAGVADRLPARVVADEGSMLGRPEVRLRHTESYVHTWLGDTRRAYAAQEAALRIYPESLARDRAKMLLHRVACMIQDGDVGGGLSYAGRVLDGLPVQHHTESVYAIGRAAMRVVPAQERGRPEAAELSARLAFSPA